LHFPVAMQINGSELKLRKADRIEPIRAEENDAHVQGPKYLT
jgi:hypothetical protein